MEAAQSRRAVAAARAVASALGLQAGDAVVIHDSDRVTLRLTPCDVLARVGPSAYRAEFAFEVEVARRLADVGGPVAELDPRAGPRVQLHDGFAVSLWTYYEPVGAPIPPAGYADALARHHAALREIDLEAPHVTERIAGALSQVHDPDRTPELSGPDREFLGGTLSELSAALSGGRAGEQLLHGEPHQDNLLNTRGGPLFVDLATCCRGPVEFDLAHAPDGVAEHYPGADHGLVLRCRALVWALFSTWRWRRDDRFPDRDHWRAEGLARVRAALGS